MPTLTQLYEEVLYKTLTVVVSVAGHELSPNPRDISYTFTHGEVPTCSFTVDNPRLTYMVEDAFAEVWVGFNNRTTMVFNGTVESISPFEGGLRIQCSGQSKLLDFPYKKAVTVTDGVLSSTQLVKNIIAAAGIASSFVDLPAWTPGTVVEQPLRFQTYAEGVNKIAEPFGSPFYEMPSGQIRVDLRDPIPAPSAWRTYFSGIINADGTYSQPASVAANNLSAIPHIRTISKEKMLRDVRNRVIVRGAEVLQIGGDGEIDKVVLEQIAEGPSPWIPPHNGEDRFIEMIVENDLLDVAADVTACAVRYFSLYNRLFENVSMVVDGDPQVFLGATVSIIDHNYTGINSKYFIHSYTCNINADDFTTQLELRGGPSAGVSPSLNPFAFFTWRNRYSPIPHKIDIAEENPNNRKPLGSKMAQFVPLGIGDPDHGEGTDGQMVIITFDGRASYDPDGRIVSWAWSDALGHAGSGNLWTVAYDPAAAGTVVVTLVVTDNDGRMATDSASVNINTFGPEDGYEDTLDDDDAGGGELNIPAFFIAAHGRASASGDGGLTRNDISQAVNRVTVIERDGVLLGIFAYGAGVFVTDDFCLTLSGGNHLDTTTATIVEILAGEDKIVAVATDGWLQGAIHISEDYGDTWIRYMELPNFVPECAVAVGDSLLIGGRNYGTPQFFGDTSNLILVDGDIIEQIPMPDNVVITQGIERIFVFGKEIFIALDGHTGGYWAADYSNPDWQNLFMTPIAVMPSVDDERYYIYAASGTIHYFTPPYGSALLGTVTPGNAMDGFGEGGMEGVMIFGTSQEVLKSFDGGRTSAPIWTDWGGVRVERLVVVSQPQFPPAADLMEIVEVVV